MYLAALALSLTIDELITLKDMSEKDNLPEADGKKEAIQSDIENPTESKTLEKIEVEQPEAQDLSSIEEIVTETSPALQRNEAETNTKPAISEDVALTEIEASNAEDAEDNDNRKRHEIEEKDYHAMSMDNLVDELETLVKTEKIQIIRDQVETIKTEFNAKFSAFLEEKKEEFLSAGGNTIDFQFNSPLKSRFNNVFKTYRSNRQAYYNNLESSLQANLSKRLEIIDNIKGLINVEENINTTYKHFKELQESWRNAGPIPRDRYNNVWNNYHHHVEIFYDFLHLNRDLRDLDFKHNLEQKVKIITRAEELAQDDNSNRAFRELQALHKIWKEELGPVDKVYREEIWQRFSAATKLIHEKRQHYFSGLDKAYEKNLEKKHDLIAQIEALAQDEENNHSAWQKKIKSIEALREEFFNAGKVPIKVNEATWAKFKESVRNFNRKKNSFYKGLKKEQYNNLQKKLELIKIAEANQDSTDFETTSALMKKIQSDWKKIGHVPRRDSDKIWKQFKGACNAYFDKLHKSKNAANAEETEALNKKTSLLEKLKTLEFTEDTKESLSIIKAQIAEWKTIGRVPYNKRFIDKKFHKAVDGLYNKLKMNKAEVDMLKYNGKLETLSHDKRLLDNENNYLRKKIDEIKGEINQLENNLQFFSNVDDNNPLVKEVHNNINKHKADLTIWETKLRALKQSY